jgi:hypothetical protein
VTAHPFYCWGKKRVQPYLHFLHKPRNVLRSKATSLGHEDCTNTETEIGKRLNVVLSGINWWVFETGMRCVYCAVQSESLYKIQFNFPLLLHYFHLLPFFLLVLLLLLHLLKLQSSVNLNLYQNCPPPLLVLLLTSPVPHGRPSSDLPQPTQATSTEIFLHVDCLLV